MLMFCGNVVTGYYAVVEGEKIVFVGNGPQEAPRRMTHAEAGLTVNDFADPITVVRLPAGSYPYDAARRQFDREYRITRGVLNFLACLDGSLSMQERRRMADCVEEVLRSQYGPDLRELLMQAVIENADWTLDFPGKVGEIVRARRPKP